jgi:hypothetical protein
MTPAQQLVDALLEDDLSCAVDDRIVLEADYKDVGVPCVVVAAPASHEPSDSLRLYYRHNDDLRARLLGGCLKRRIEELPLGEVITAVSYLLPFGGRLTVRVGSLVEDATCQV